LDLLRKPGESLPHFAAIEEAGYMLRCTPGDPAHRPL